MPVFLPTTQYSKSKPTLVLESKYVFLLTNEYLDFACRAKILIQFTSPFLQENA